MADQLRSLTVSGFKSLYRPQTIEVGGLTVLAGANNSGKSSFMQPLLLMKQTLDAPFDPGTLRLDGANVCFTSVDQFLCRQTKNATTDSSGFAVSFADNEGNQLSLHFQRARPYGVNLDRAEISGTGHQVVLRPGLPVPQGVFGDAYKAFEDRASTIAVGRDKKWVVIRDRCFLRLELQLIDSGGEQSQAAEVGVGFGFSPGLYIQGAIESLIHVTGVRGSPSRNYNLVALGNKFPGTFETYFASIIHKWSMDQPEKLEQLGESLRVLGLSQRVRATRKNDTQVEVEIGRVPPSFHQARESEDFVNIADVGVGVSQVMPVLVALLAAQPGQLVYIEQPEIHLHPTAQLRMADLLARAVRSGSRVIVETHSSLLIRGIQTLVANKALGEESVALNWFERDESGMTKVSSARLDDKGAFGKWPLDFDEVYMAAEAEYLDAGEATEHKG